MVLAGNMMIETESLRSHIKIQILLMVPTHFVLLIKATETIHIYERYLLIL